MNVFHLDDMDGVHAFCPLFRTVHVSQHLHHPHAFGSLELWKRRALMMEQPAAGHSSANKGRSVTLLVASLIAFVSSITWQHALNYLFAVIWPHQDFSCHELARTV